MERPQIRSAAEIRAVFKKKYGRLVNHYRRWQSPQPDTSTDPRGFAKWSKSRAVMEHTLRIEDHDLYDSCPRSYRLLSHEADYDEYRLWTILERLAVPINTRLDSMIDNRRRRNWVESPTNAKQTLRAIEQIEEELTERTGPILVRYDFKLDELEAAVEAGGGVLSDGTKKQFSGAELEDLTARIKKRKEELEEGDLVVDLMNPKRRDRLEERRRRYLNLLPPHYKEKLGLSFETKPRPLQR